MTKEEGIHSDAFNDDDEGVQRYFAYVARLRNLVTTGSRYVAFTSDVGEAFRPMVPAWAVTSAYAMSGVYVVADVAYHGYLAHKHGHDIGKTVAERSVFQVLASLALPAIAIHTVVDVSAKVIRSKPNLSQSRYLRYAPTALGLAVIPFLPALVDHPVENLVEDLFKTYWPKDDENVSNEKKSM